MSSLKERLRRDLAAAEARARAKEMEAREKDRELKKAQEDWREEVGKLRGANTLLEDRIKELLAQVGTKDSELKKAKEDWRAEVVKLRRQNTLLEDRVAELLGEVQRACSSVQPPACTRKVGSCDVAVYANAAFHAAPEAIHVSERVQVVERLVEGRSLPANQKADHVYTKQPQVPPVAKLQQSNSASDLDSDLDVGLIWQQEKELRLLSAKLEEACREKDSNREQLLLLKMKALSANERARLSDACDNQPKKSEASCEGKRATGGNGRPSATLANGCGKAPAGKSSASKDKLEMRCAEVAACRALTPAAEGSDGTDHVTAKKEAGAWRDEIQKLEYQVKELQVALSESASELELAKEQLEGVIKALADVESGSRDRVGALEADKTTLAKTVEEMQVAVHTLTEDKRQLKLDSRRAAQKLACAKKDGRNGERDDGSSRARTTPSRRFRLPSEGLSPSIIKWLEEDVIGAGLKMLFGSGVDRMMTW